MKKHMTVALSVVAMLLAGLLVTAAAAPPGSDTTTIILQKLDQILAAVRGVNLAGVTQNWDKSLPATDPGGPCPSSSSRFTCVFGNTAVRDNETGLVWASPRTGALPWYYAREACANDTTGGRKGWRLPSVHELASLIDPTQSNPALPAGHPFIYQWSANGYWSATTDSGFVDPLVVWAVRFNDALGQPSGTVGPLAKSYPGGGNTWCVRGGLMNTDQY